MGVGTRRAVVAATIALGVLGVGALALGLYDRAHRDELLPGVTIGGVDAGGRRAADVLAALDDRLPATGSASVRVTAGDRDVQLPLSRLGLRSDAAEVVAAARDDAARMGLGRRVWHRLGRSPVGRAYDVRLRVGPEAVRRAVEDLARQVDVAPVDARVDTSSGLVTVAPAVEGHSLDVEATTERVVRAAGLLANGGTAPIVVAPVAAVPAAVTGYADVLLVRTAENRLYHYDNGVLAKTYLVATGSSRYPTPTGTFDVVLKRRNPTWVNPDPRGWGARLPARIGPGPRNPLGTRAMNLSAPGIRIHGTANVGSLGHNASHGCIRMAMADVEELFDQVEAGTPVAVITGPPPPPAAVPPAPPPPATAPAAPSVGDPDAPVDLEAG